MNRKQVLPEVELSATPQALRAVDFCALQTYHGEGRLTVGALPRVALELDISNPDDGFDWQIQSQFTANQVGALEQTLRLKLKGQASMTCQRCLQAFQYALNVERLFIFVGDEAAADAYPMEDDLFDPLVSSPHFDVLALIEDEILLSLPLVPKHPEASCSTSPLLGIIEEPENPFKVLKNIKK